MVANVLPFLGAVLSVFITALGQVLLKYGISQSALASDGVAGDGTFSFRSVVELFLNPFVVTGFMAYALSALTWMYVLSKLPLSQAYPFIGLSIVATSIAGVFLFDERMSVVQIIGTLLICAGVVMVARS